MVQRFAHGPLGWRFVLRPNRSATWAEAKIFLAVMATVCLGIATGFALMGFWPVLPFAGAEIALLAYALWRTCYQAGQTEVVDIDDARVAVERGMETPQQRWSFQRAWARVVLVPSRLARHPSRLMIGSHGNHVHVGRFLTESERLRLARDLKDALALPLRGSLYETNEEVLNRSQSQ